MARTPDIAVIVVVHNDSEHLPASIASVTCQSHQDIEILVVDDCSDDDSLAVAEACASRDDRIRVLSTTANSGGPGGPRNVGLDSAVAPWVTFLDSDDLLAEDAIARFMDAAREKVDVVCGLTRRVFLEDGTVSDWRPELYTESRSVDSIDEYVDLVIDTTATGKAYRREFLARHGFRFIEGLHYEDLVFTAQVYSAARGISVIPYHVYTWYFYPSAVRKSISNRRDEAANLEHRLEAITRVERVVEQAGTEKMRMRYQLKFLGHDARLYLRELGGLCDEDAGRIVSRLSEPLERIDEGVYAELTGAERLLFGAVLAGWVDGARELIPAIYGRVTLDGAIAVSHGTRIWVPSGASHRLPAADSLAHRLLAVDATSLPESRAEEVLLAHRVSSIESQGDSALVIRGETCDPLSAFSAGPGPLTGRVVAKLRDDEATFVFPVRVRVSEQRLEWEFVLRVPLMQPFVRPMRYDVSIEIAGPNGSNLSPVFLDGRGEVSLAARPWTLRGLLRQTFLLYATPSGRLAMRLRQLTGRRGRIEERLLRVAAGIRRVTGH